MRGKIIKVKESLNWMLICLWLAGVSAWAGTTWERLPRTDLMVYHDSRGAVAAVNNRRDWEKRRSEILKGCQDIMGPLPGKEKHCALDVKIEREKDRGTYVEQFITYASEPGSRVPA